MLDYKEPSLAFYQGGTIREAKQGLLVHGRIDDLPPWLVVTRDIWEKTPAALRDRLEVIASFWGLEYNDRRVVEVLVVRKR